MGDLIAGNTGADVGTESTAQLNDTGVILTSTAAVVPDALTGTTTQTNGDALAADVGEQSSPLSSGGGGTAEVGNVDAASTAAGGPASGTASSAANALPVDGTQGSGDDTDSGLHPHTEATGIVSRLRTAVQSAEAEVATALEAEFARLEQLLDLLKHL